MTEIWKDIEGYEGLYQVSNLGRVKSIERADTYNLNEMSIKRPRAEKYLKFQDNHGYKRVSLCKNSKGKWHMVHRLVAETFIQNPYNLPQVNHKDENKTNNFVWVNEDGSVDVEKSNLEWCDSIYNMNYGNRNKKSQESLLNRKDLSKPVHCHELGQTFVSIKEASRITGAHIASIQRCACGKQKTANGLTWEYVF